MAYRHLVLCSAKDVRQAFFQLSHKSSFLNFIYHMRHTNKYHIHMWVSSPGYLRSQVYAYIYLAKQNWPWQVFLTYQAEVLNIRDQHRNPTASSGVVPRLEPLSRVSPPSTLTSHPWVAIRPLLTCPAQNLWPRGKWLPHLITTPLSHPAPSRPGRLISHALNLLIRLFHVRFLYLGS